MDYLQLRHTATTGDVLGVKGTGLFSKIVHFFTKEDFTHVALLVWHGTGLWVYEFVEGTGYQCMPASQWYKLRNGQNIFFGKSPIIVRTRPHKVIDLASSFRASESAQKYGLYTLFLVWLSQKTGKEYKVVRNVCSTFVQTVWEGCGISIDKNSTPGSIMKISKCYGPLQRLTDHGQ
jgi:hypothetical protein